MLKNSVEKNIRFIKQEKRVLSVAVFLCLVFLVNRTLYGGQKITAENCAEGKCVTAEADQPQLDADNAYYYADDVLKDMPSGYYRLTFSEKSDQKEKISVQLDNYTEKVSSIGEIELAPSDSFRSQEMFFYLPEGFTGILFQKSDPAGKGSIFIDGVGASKLFATSQSELSQMRKTVVGQEADQDAVLASQTKKNYAFSWLKDSKTMLGQVFLATDDVMSGVGLDIDIIKDLDPSSRQYTLALRPVDYDGESVSFSGATISDVAFSVSGLEKYRQADGTFRFPLYGSLEKGKYYAVSIDNSKVSVNDRNYLELRGTRDVDNYSDGAAFAKTLGTMTLLDGDLDFKIYGADLPLENGARLLAGAKIEDLGGGIGKYSYVTKGKPSDIFDLAVASSGTEFSNDSRVVFAPAKEGNAFGYAVNTLYPIKQLRLSGQQVKTSWGRVKVSYSFDNKNWTELSSVQAAGSASDPSVADAGSDNSDNSDNTDSSANAGDQAGDQTDTGTDDQSGSTAPGELQTFDDTIIPAGEAETIYLRIAYDSSDQNKTRYFGLKNLSITADLKMR